MTLISRTRRRAHLRRLAQDIVHLVAIADELLDMRPPPPDDDGLRSPALQPGRSPGGVADPTGVTAATNVDRPAEFVDTATADAQDLLRRHLAYLAEHAAGAMRLAAILRPDLTSTCVACRRPFVGSAREGRCDACYRRLASGTRTAGQRT